MTSIRSFRLYALDLPFKKPFKHAAAERTSTESIVLKCETDTGVIGFGECLPREYVTRETRDGAFELLKTYVLPRLLGRSFDDLDAVRDFLSECDGKAPRQWVDPVEPQNAAWCAVDLSLLDAFGRAFGESALPNSRQEKSTVKYSAVASADIGWKLVKSLLKLRLFGMTAVKIKVEGTGSSDALRLARRVLGEFSDIRVDANMDWSLDEALAEIPKLAAYGVSSIEQPISAEDIGGLSRLVTETGLQIMADESFSDRESLDRLIDQRACNAINLRISKCGGLIASLKRAQEASAAGLVIQVGCQVGETSLLSAAQRLLIENIDAVSYAEGCFGLHLLKCDPVSPLLQFGYGGKPPALAGSSGLGISMNEDMLQHFSSRSVNIEQVADA